MEVGFCNETGVQPKIHLSGKWCGNDVEVWLLDCDSSDKNTQIKKITNCFNKILKKTENTRNKKTKFPIFRNLNKLELSMQKIL